MSISKTQRAAWADALVNPRQTTMFDIPTKAIQNALTELSVSQLHTPKGTRVPKSSYLSRAPTFKLTHESVITCALKAFDEGAKPGMLVFCSATKPGGGWLNGAVAQEEAISYCSTWGLYARHKEFHNASRPAPFYGSELITLDGYLVASEIGNWLSEPVPCFFAGFAAPNMKAAKDKNMATQTPQMKKQVFDALLQGFLSTLEAFNDAGCTHALLGPIGCGVFENDPAICASAAFKAIGSRDWGFNTIEFSLGENPSPAIANAFVQELTKFQSEMQSNQWTASSTPGL